MRHKALKSQVDFTHVNKEECKLTVQIQLYLQAKFSYSMEFYIGLLTACKQDQNGTAVPS